MADGLAGPPNPGVMSDYADAETVEQVEQSVVMILIGMAQEDRVDPADAACPECRRDDPAADARVAQPAAVVQERPTIGSLDQHSQAMADRQELDFEGRSPRWQRSPRAATREAASPTAATRENSKARRAGSPRRTHWTRATTARTKAM